MLDMHYSIFELVDYPVEQLDTLPAEDIHFLLKVTEAYNEYRSLATPEPADVRQIMRRCLRIFAPHQLH